MAQSVQVAAPSAAAIVPAAHGVGTVLPVEHEWPALHAVQLSACHRSVPLEYEPDGHGSGADAPSAQNEPAVQTLQAVAPSVSWKVLALHLVHASCARRSLYVPAAQSVIAALPTGQKVPVPHSMQSAALVITPLACLVVPPGHGRGEDAPSMQK